jgi:Mg2+ and Co2+ transporter CorA
MSEKVLNLCTNHPNSVEQCRCTLFSSKLAATIDAANQNDRTTPEGSFTELLDNGQGDSFWWIHTTERHEEELNAVPDTFVAPPSRIKHTNPPGTREKVESSRLYQPFCFRSLLDWQGLDEEHLSPQNLYLAIHRGGISTFASRQSPHARDVKKKIGQLHDSFSIDIGWICCALM